MTPPDTRRPWSSDDDEQPPVQPPLPPTGRGDDGPPRRRLPIAALVLVSAAIGGAGSAGVLAATGAFDRTEVRTVTTAAATTTPTAAATSDSGAGTGLNAKAVYANASPGVVSITSKGVSSDESAPVSPFGGGPQQGTSVATGTGFFYDDQGHILTAEHVVDGASSIVVTLQDGTKRTAELLGSDNATDVAVLKIDPSGLDIKPLSLGSSAGLAIGDEVAAIGDPFGYQRSISTGIASGLDRTIQAPNGFTVAHAVQTDAALNPGNSGGPLVDTNGRVIGIVDQIATGGGTSEQSSGVGFAVPIDLVAGEVKTLETGGDVRHAYVGVSTADSSNTTSGAVIASVIGDGPAAAGGVRSGDVVTAIDGTKIEGSNDLVAAIATHKPGETVQVTVRRNGQTETKSVTLGTQPAQSPSTGG